MCNVKSLRENYVFERVSSFGQRLIEFHLSSYRQRRVGELLSAASLMMFDIVSLFLLVRFLREKKIEKVFIVDCRDDGTRMIDENCIEKRYK